MMTGSASVLSVTPNASKRWTTRNAMKESARKRLDGNRNVRQSKKKSNGYRYKNRSV